MVKEKNKEKIVKKINKEIKELENPKKRKKKNKVENKFTIEPYLIDKKAEIDKRNKRIMLKLELIAIVIFSLILLFLLCNRTFFKNKYVNSKININIPLLMYYKSDDGNRLTLKTLRKTKYVKEYFDNELSNLKKYNCGDFDFYYDDINYFVIYDVKIEKNIFVKTITIDYASGNPECLCSVNVKGKEAEEMCLR